MGGRQFGWGIHLAGVEVVKYTVGSHLRNREGNTFIHYKISVGILIHDLF